MRVAALVPHLKPFGGIRRFLEIGNVFVDSPEVDYTVLCPHPKMDMPLEWFDYRGVIRPLTPPTEMGDSYDLVIVGDPPSFRYLDRFPSTQVYVYVIAGGEYTAQYKGFLATSYKHLSFVNNRVFLKDFPEARVVEGGVDINHFRSYRRFKVGYYAGRGDTKGESTIVESLSGLPNVELLPIQNILNKDLPVIYRSLDYFVAWEQRTGWSNTAAEAAACGVPVITNGVNVEPWADRAIVVKDLRRFFTCPMMDLSWGTVAAKLLELWKADGWI